MAQTGHLLSTGTRDGSGNWASKRTRRIPEGKARGMRLLVSNSRNAQAYATIRSLRGCAERIVALAERKWPLEQYLAHGAFAPEVDRRVVTGWPTGDWDRGNHSSANTPQEERYIATVERVCAEEAIDWAFPSVDGTVYVFAKNRERLEKRGVSVVCPSLDVVRVVNDKYRSLDALAGSGVPVPRTLLPSYESLDAAGRAVGFPLVVKPLYASASRGVHVVRDFAELRSVYAAVSKRYGRPIVQEYIPGPLDGGFLRVIGVADSTGNVVALHVCRTLLTLFPDAVLPPAIARSETNPEIHAITARIAKVLGITGPFLMQYKVDARDGAPKLLEVNCKLSYRVWTTIADGLDIPRLALDAAANREMPPIVPRRVGTVFVNVPELFLARWLSPRRARSAAPVLHQGPRVMDPYATDFLRRPHVALLWWIPFLGFAFKEQMARWLTSASHRGR